MLFSRLLLASGTALTRQAARGSYPPPSLRKAATTIPHRRFPIRAPIEMPMASGQDCQEQGWAMTEKEDRLAREREEIAARVRSFKATQEKFERERHEYYATTLGSAWSGFARTPQQR
jgi:hypothetical protein